MFLVIDKYVFSEWLRTEMTKRTWSQSDLSRASGIHRAIISKIINQNSSPETETIKAIARGLQLPPEEVFRAAGLLPPVTEERSKMSELDHLANLLGDEDLDDLIEYARMRLKRADDKQEYKVKTSRSKRPARTALISK